jgi:hypothetical protein
MTKRAIVILPAFACVALFGRGEPKPGKTTSPDWWSSRWPNLPKCRHYWNVKNVPRV